MNAFLFKQLAPFDRLKRVQFSLSVIVIILLVFGPYDRFYVDLSPLLYEQQWFPNLGVHFWTLKFSVIFFAILALFNNKTSKVLFALSFLFFNYYVKSFSTTWWITNTHLNFFAIALCFVPKERDKKSYELASFLIAFMMLYVSTLYLQAGVSKLIHGGFSWFLHGDRIWTETVLLGTPFGKCLTQYPQVFTFLSMGTGVFELLLPPFFLLKSTQRTMVLIAFLFHTGTFLILGISFWFLWLLYPALFMPALFMTVEKNCPKKLEKA